MRIVVAMDSFKGSLTAVRACEIVAESIRSAIPQADIIIKPMADGGEGTAQAMIAGGKGQWIKRTVVGPLPDMRIRAGFAWFPAERMAVVEMAAASGLQLLSPQQRDPLKTTTYGTGQLITAAIDHGAVSVYRFYIETAFTTPLTPGSIDLGSHLPSPVTAVAVSYVTARGIMPI